MVFLIAIKPMFTPVACQWRNAGILNLFWRGHRIMGYTPETKKTETWPMTLGSWTLQAYVFKLLLENDVCSTRHTVRHDLMNRLEILNIHICKQENLIFVNLVEGLPDFSRFVQIGWHTSSCTSGKGSRMSGRMMETCSRKPVHRNDCMDLDWARTW